MRLLDVSNNATIALKLGDKAVDVFDSPGAAWLHGLLIGIGLGLRKPEIAQALRSELEALNGRLIGESPERVEVSLRELVDLFEDRT